MNRYWLLLGTVGSLSIAGSFAAVPSLVLAQNSDNGSGPCAAALAQDSVCEAANQRALEIMRAEHLVAITVVQDVRTAALIAFAATDPAKDLKQYGFPANPVAAALDMSLWTEVPSQWRERLAPAAAGHSLSERTSANDWADTLSLGETRFTVTALSLSRFLQAVGNGGVMLPAEHDWKARNQTRAMIWAVRPFA